MAEQESPPKNREKTIDLAEWQKKNQAYLEKRAKEKAEKEKETAKQESEVDEKELEADDQDQSEETTSNQDQSEDSEADDDREATEDQEAEADGSEADLEGREDGDEETGENDDSSEVDETDQDDQDPEESDEKLEQDQEAESALAADVLAEKRMKQAQARAMAFKASPVFLMAFLMLVAGAYFISPWSRSKHITVSGNTQLTQADILAASGILAEDYTVTTILQQGAYGKAISKNLPLVKSAKVNYHFPVTFKIKVEEYYTLAYVKDGHYYHSVLSSGAVLADQIAEENLPQPSLIIQMTDLAMVKKLVVALDLLDKNLLAKLQRIELSATPASKDLLRIVTVEGHDLLVPLGEVSKKLPYYDKILPKLTVPSIIDMEVGLFSYPK